MGGRLWPGIAVDGRRSPRVVHRGYGLPAGAGERPLVIAASQSGETVETLSGADEARRRQLPLVVISTGGRLGGEATADKTPHLHYEWPGQPRAAIGLRLGAGPEPLGHARLVAGSGPPGPAGG